LAKILTDLRIVLESMAHSMCQLIEVSTIPPQGMVFMYYM